jgi:hypothetical protein
MGLRAAAGSDGSRGADGPLLVPWDPLPVIDLTEDEDDD